MEPTAAGYLLFIRQLLGIPTDALPNDSSALAISYNVALMIVNEVFKIIPNPNPALPSLYALMVYNLAADRLVNFAPDIDGAPIYPGTDLPYFSGMRKTLGLLAFVPGLITASYDQGTGQSIQVTESLKNATVLELQFLKTPWGRAYMGYAQMLGSSPWGMS